MSTRTIKKLLLSLIVVGVLGSFAARGTYAVLNAETSQSNESIGSGTLLLENTVGTNATCQSLSFSLNVNTACNSFFTSPLMYPIPTGSNPPASTTYASTIVGIKDSGTLGGTLKIYLSACTATTNGSAPSFSWTAINPCCPGGTYPCTDGQKGSLSFFIQECGPASSGTTCTALTTPACVWPVSTVANCTFVDDSLGDFNSFHHDNTHYLSLGALASGATRYFTIAVAEPGDAANGLQGQTATFGLRWHLE
jgi:hypothetical protein